MSGSVPPGMMWNPVWISGTSGQTDPYATSAVYVVPDEPMFIPDPNWGATHGPSDNTIGLPPLPSVRMDFSSDAAASAWAQGLLDKQKDTANAPNTAQNTQYDPNPQADEYGTDDGSGRQALVGGAPQQAPVGDVAQQARDEQARNAQQQAPQGRLAGAMGGGGGETDAGGYSGVMPGNDTGNLATLGDPAGSTNPLGATKAAAGSGAGSGAGYGGIGAASAFWGASYGGVDYEEPSLKWPGQFPTDSFLQPFQAYFKQLPTFY